MNARNDTARPIRRLWLMAPILFTVCWDMINVRPASERGRTRLDWLDSRHTFSFGDYYDPHHMGFRSLRVINDDRVAPGQGFGRGAQPADSGAARQRRYGGAL